MPSSRKPKKIIYVLLVLIPFVLLWAGASTKDMFKQPASGFVSWPARVLSWPIHEVRKLIHYRRNHHQLQLLQRERDALKSRLIGLEEVLRENNRYEKLLQFKRKLVFSSIAAVVIGRDPFSWNTSLLINKGSQDGLEIGMPVVNHLGVVGKIAEVSDTQSKVILVTDPSFQVAALGQNTRESGLLTGSLSGMCRMKYLPEQSVIERGHKVITSKLSEDFPEGLLIGEVMEVTSGQNGAATECLVKPAVELNHLEEVLVIKK